MNARFETHMNERVARVADRLLWRSDDVVTYQSACKAAGLADGRLTREAWALLRQVGLITPTREPGVWRSQRAELVKGLKARRR